jgi:putative membrane protein
LVLFLGFSLFGKARAQMMGNFYRGKQLNISGSDWEEILRHTKTEEQEGKEIWGKLQSKSLNCENLSDEDFGKLGEYFMRQITGGVHASMNAMMMQMHGKEGEEQMHIAMGKRMSGCKTNASLPENIPSIMMYMMSGWSSPSEVNNKNTMMWNFSNYPMSWFGFGLGWLFMVLFWILVVIGLIALIRWLVNQNKEREEKSAMDILKERYAKGEIDKKEFEEKKKDII